MKPSYHLLVQAAVSVGFFVGGLGHLLAFAFFVYGGYVLALPFAILALPGMAAMLFQTRTRKIQASWAGWFAQWTLLTLAIGMEMAYVYRW